MSNLFLIFVLCALTISHVKSATNKLEWTMQAEVYREDCRKEVGATQSDVEDLALHKPLKTKTAHCLAACFMKKYNAMDENGKFDKSAALEYMKNSMGGNEAKFKIITEVIEICAKIPLPSDHCDASEALFECFHKQFAEKSKQ